MKKIKINLILKILIIINLGIIIMAFLVNKDEYDINNIYLYTGLTLNILFLTYLFTKYSNKQNVLNIIITFFLLFIMFIFPTYTKLTHSIKSSGNYKTVLGIPVAENASYVETKIEHKNIYGLDIRKIINKLKGIENE